MAGKTSALTARTRLGQIVSRAVDNNERFLVERNGEPHSFRFLRDDSE
jgi:hypothetical protein